MSIELSQDLKDQIKDVKSMVDRLNAISHILSDKGFEFNYGVHESRTIEGKRQEFLSLQIKVVV